jgi:hypothetical protein
LTWCVRIRDLIRFARGSYPREIPQTLPAELRVVIVLVLILNSEKAVSFPKLLASSLCTRHGQAWRRRLDMLHALTRDISETSGAGNRGCARDTCCEHYGTHMYEDAKEQGVCVREVLSATASPADQMVLGLLVLGSWVLVLGSRWRLIGSWTADPMPADQMALGLLYKE